MLHIIMLLPLETRTFTSSSEVSSPCYTLLTKRLSEKDYIQPSIGRRRCVDPRKVLAENSLRDTREDEYAGLCVNSFEPTATVTTSIRLLPQTLPYSSSRNLDPTQMRKTSSHMPCTEPRCNVDIRGKMRQKISLGAACLKGWRDLQVGWSLSYGTLTGRHDTCGHQC
ncbi:hypothetical protein BJX66DRAFT_98469 [Aspergillus keveii]|uniref:Uncharacterized protein n=1 Tax=Aspergillus keveii TaxID=714993 RepID=A0ABR4GNS8_9EURO